MEVMKSAIAVVVLCGMIGCAKHDAPKPSGAFVGYTYWNGEPAESKPQPAKPAAGTTDLQWGAFDQGTSPKPAPIDCFHAAAPELAKLEQMVGPVVIEDNAKYAAQYDNPELLWYGQSARRRDKPDSYTDECVAFGRTIRAVVKKLFVHCTPAYQAAADKERARTSHDDDDGKRQTEARLPKYQRMIAAQKKQCGEDQ